MLLQPSEMPAAGSRKTGKQVASILPGKIDTGRNADDLYTFSLYSLHTPRILMMKRMHRVPHLPDTTTSLQQHDDDSGPLMPHTYMNFHKNRKFTSLRNQITFGFTLDIQDKLRVKGEDWHHYLAQARAIQQQQQYTQ